NAMPLVVDPSRVIKGDPCWGFNHEVGHVHQLRPYFNWGGLGEVSNNVVTLYGTTAFGNRSRLSAGNFYQKAKENIIDKKISYLQNDNILQRLVPFWQLHLYFSKHGNPDFYPDLHEVFRNQPAAMGNDWGSRGTDKVAEYQLNFIKQSCIVSKTDLTDFFDQYGFFHVGEFEINDYGKYQYKMTQEMVDNLKAEIKALNLPKPKVPVESMID
ncbi:MAG: M60 family metallopeptidase, partial [Lentisphaeria bacterium]